MVKRLVQPNILVQVPSIARAQYGLRLYCLGLLVIDLADQVLEPLLAFGHVGLEHILAVVASPTILTLKGSVKISEFKVSISI